MSRSMPRLGLDVMLLLLVGSAACGPPDPPRTLREACEGLGEHICERWDDCQWSDKEAKCREVFTRECCYRRNCDEPAPHVTRDQWGDCLDSIDGLKCWFSSNYYTILYWTPFYYPPTCPNVWRPQE